MIRPISANSIACTIDPQSWDLDEGSYLAGIDAKAECSRCPRLGQCKSELSAMIAAKTPPRAVIWAGIAFTHRGRVIRDDHELESYYRRVIAQRNVDRRSAA